ncbi:MAG: lipoyl synthase [Chlamydiae bacterium RIFCSPHIGHO2_12_FULL_49_9]|nr:MAG: lipoyl synthase [Chlamydiae bacterium RIFCSPHIGHO2_12_FULL_49_9]
MNKLNVLPQNPEVEESQGRFPSWLHRKLPLGGQIFKTNTLIDKYKLNTVCEEAKCPNRFECYTKKTATFLALGKECTRNCGFCDIDFSKTPKAPEADEPIRIALSVKELGLKHAVITMVARDDLPDQGASHIARIIQAIRQENKETTIEALTSDFSGDFNALHTVLEARPEIFNHNIETVRSLSTRVRHKAEYDRTLSVLHFAKESKLSIFVKSGIMLGLGETEEEVKQTIQDLKDAGCDIITIGQYLQASRKKLRVKEFIHPDLFKAYEDYGNSLGVKYMYSGPFVRSSYNANLFAEGLLINSH